MELEVALERIWEQIKLIWNAILIIASVYFIYQSIFNPDLFNALYVEPIFNFLYQYIIPLIELT